MEENKVIKMRRKVPTTPNHVIDVSSVWQKYLKGGRNKAKKGRKHGR